MAANAKNYVLVETMPEYLRADGTRIDVSARSKVTGNLLGDLEQALTAAVERSKSHHEIVRVEVDDVRAARASLGDLYGACLELDDADGNDGVLEVWAESDEHESGMLWRLELVPMES